MTKLLGFFLTILIQTTALGETIAVPSPETMLREANLVATCSLHQRGAGWELIIEEPLKGAQKRGDRARLESQFSAISFSFDGFSKLVGSNLFLFVGKFDEEARVARPSYGNCSAWPQGTTEALLPARTLADAVFFAKKSMGLPVSSTSNPTQPVSAPKNTPSKVSLKAPLLATEAPPERAAPQAAPRLPTLSEEPPASTPWITIVMLIVAAVGLLWLLLKRLK